MSVSELLEGARDTYDELESLHQEKRKLEADIMEEQQKVEDSVIMALYQIQDDLGDDEAYTLMHSTETGRGGQYSFDEVLTAEGVEARNVTRNGEPGYSGDDMWMWPGSWDSFEEPLDIEDEYLVGERDSQGFFRKLHRRMSEDEIPESSFFYD
ncbi:hypothetical protein [Candidatus Nanohalovita haloferacivicina]|uniref:hypothetical protein n=1 Tax=Candidatus Nanohalovita haloferacivicina TaxID=2978046 RepID=UPI00325FD858|nr:hypothetical protein HBNXNv_0903 [Candidatus Nanohalobia archaeon BNXNv]